MRSLTLLFGLVSVLGLSGLTGCGGKDGGDTGEVTGATTDSGTDDGADDTGPATDDTDSGSASDDTGLSDTAPADTEDTNDTGVTGDTGDTADTVEAPLDGFGELTGDCWLLDKEQLTGPDAWVVSNTLDFGEQAFDYDALSEGGQAIYDDGNLGGSSEYSEIFAYEALYRCEGAEMLRSEGEIEYLDAGGKKTDLLVRIDGYDIGVSVTRAYGYPPEDPYTEEQALDLLSDKLADVLVSTANVNTAKNSWTKQILHVIAYTPGHAETILTAYASVDAETRADTILVVTATEGDDEHLY